MKTQKTLKAPRGFRFSTAEASIKKPGRQDLALIVSDVEATMAGVFTTNAVKAAPVRLGIKRVATGRGQAIIVNSGNANACTGKQGLADADRVCRVTAKHLGIQPSLVYPASTGVIGNPLPMERIIPALAVVAAGSGSGTLGDVARAIMTTDTFPKMVSKSFRLGSATGTVAGICKGAGMIAPNMATMLCFMLTDIAVEQKALDLLLREAADRTFNLITIDGDMSTNDTVLAMANGVAGNRPLTRTSPEYASFRKAFGEVMQSLARLVVQDGEGATKLVEVRVRGAKSERDAARAAFSIANSSLVKTAIYGNDANWGRIICAVGYSGVPIREEKTDIWFNRVKVVQGGLATNRDKQATEALKSKTLTITIDLHSGTAEAEVLTCDLTEDYIKINAEYRT